MMSARVRPEQAEALQELRDIVDRAQATLDSALAVLLAGSEVPPASTIIAITPDGEVQYAPPE